MTVLTIARLTVAEAARRRILLILLILTLVSVSLTTWGIDRLVSLARESGTEEFEVQIAVSQILILVAFMFSFVLAMTAAFMGAPAIAADLDSGVAHSMLARPIRRADLVIGRWLGLAVIVAGYTAASGMLEVGAVQLVTGYSPPQAWVAIAFLSAQSIILLTLAVALSTVIPSIAAGAVCVVVFGLGWMAGVFAGVGRFFEAGALVSVAEASRWILPSDGLWRGAVYGLEPPLVAIAASGGLGPRADANPFYAAAPPATAFIVWSVAWVALVLGLAVVALSRRDL